MWRRCGTAMPMRIRGGTKRDPARKSDGKRLAAVARMMGTPLIPWQRYVADVATEIDPNTGTFYYNTVVLSTPRQCGKSTLVDASDTYNSSLGRGRNIIYSAQTGRDAEDHFKDYAETMRHSKLAQKIDRFHFSNGNMSVGFSNGSKISPMAMTKVAGHGKHLDKVTLDEAFSLSKESAKIIMDAIIPTMNTRLKLTGMMPQRWITSTEGTSESTYFNELLDSLRAGEVPSRTCWFDFGIPEDADPEDLDVIMKWHPAAGYLWYKPQLRDFRDEFEDNVAGWARAFGNRRDTGIVDRVISAELWDSTVASPIRPDELDGQSLVISAAVDMDATSTSIAVGIRNDNDTTTVQLLKVLQGTGDAPNMLRRLCTQYHAPLIMDNRGPNADLRDRLEAMRDEYDEPVINFVQMQAADYLATGQSFVSGLQNGVVLHANDPDLDSSAAVCARTWSGDAWRITRRGTTGMTSPLESAILAAWGVAHMPDENDGLQIY